MCSLVSDLGRGCAALWWHGATDFPDRLPAYTPPEQARREGHLERFLERITAELAAPPEALRAMGETERGALERRILEAFGAFALAALDWEPRHLEVLLSHRLSRIGMAFAQAARGFDPQVTGSAIYQAGRNVWTINGLQILLGAPVALTPAIVGYSLLYPYTDNYLDDPAVSPTEKRAFNARLNGRLRGEAAPSANRREEQVWGLVGLIEGQYERGRYPRVYESLLAIQRAQEASLRLLDRDARGRMPPPYTVDVLGVSLEKGGASVLADGYLVSGELTREQARFLFEYGALLQLADDLQDVESDSADGLMTVYSHAAAGGWPLDPLANRTFHVAEAVWSRLPLLGAPSGAEPLQELMRRSIDLLLIDAVGRVRRRFSPAYVAAMERRSPFRFAYLRRVRRKLARQHLSLLALIEAFSQGGMAPELG